MFNIRKCAYDFCIKELKRYFINNEPKSTNLSLTASDGILFELFISFFNFKKNGTIITGPFMNIIETIKKMDNFFINFDENIYFLFNRLFIAHLKSDNEFQKFYFLRGENYKQLANNKHYFTIFVLTLAIAIISNDLDVYKTNFEDFLLFYNTLTNNLCRTYCGKIKLFRFL
jgi:hypothetical protein